MTTPNIVPILLAAGSSAQLGFPKALAGFGGRTALEIAVRNCFGLAKPVLVLGDQAARVRAARCCSPLYARNDVQVVVNRRWRAGQLNSVIAGLRRVPRNAAFMIYPVDHPFLTPRLIRRLVNAFEARAVHQTIIMPRFAGRAGHPVILAAELRNELRRARTAREVVYRDLRRIRYVDVASSAICLDFDSRASYTRLRGQFASRRSKPHKKAHVKVRRKSRKKRPRKP
jgi:CTP:molybdopterin cytidylyltransferase MocA